MKEITIKNIEKIMKTENLRIFIEIKEEIEKKNCILNDISNENMIFFIKAFSYDRLIIIQSKKNSLLFRIENLDERKQQVNLELIMSIEIIEFIKIKTFMFAKFHIFLPVVILKNTFIVPFENTSILLGRKFSVNAAYQSLQNETDVLVAKQILPEIEDLEAHDLFKEATICSISEIQKEDQNNSKAIFNGKYRVNIIDCYKKNGTFFAYAHLIYENYNQLNFNIIQKSYFLKLQTLKQKTGNLNIPNELIEFLINSIDPLFFIFTIVTFTIFEVSKRIEIMQSSLQEILEILLIDMNEKIYYLDFDNEINEKTKEIINEKNKQVWIKSKIEALKKQSNFENEYEDEFMVKTSEDPGLYPEHVTQILQEEIKKLKKLHTASLEAFTIRQHIELIYSLPWYTLKDKNPSAIEVSNYLDKEHAGSNYLKEMLIRSVFNFLDYDEKKNKPKNGKGAIILLLGPPGVGKTSIAKALADALHLPSYKISMAGMSDSSALVGFPRTYVGASYGYFVRGLEKCKVLNPVFIVDEIDKANRNSGKDPISVLYKAIDPDDNKDFKDFYLDATIDLSNVTWILTANSVENVHEAILDRCIIIDVNGYSFSEKIEIGKKIFAKLYNKKDIKISESVLSYLIAKYTNESGARTLSKYLSWILQDMARKKIENKKKSIEVTESDIDHILRFQNYLPTEFDGESKIGMIKMLAWSPMGGSVLHLYCKAIPRTSEKEDLKFTGNIKNVMQESLQIAMSFIKINAKKFDIDLDFFKDNFIHISTENAATPKDGPSAGVALCAILISLLKQIPISPYIAITGEVTLHGIGPVGGFPEKIFGLELISIKENLAYPSSPVKYTAFVPESNKSQILNNINSSVLDSLNIIGYKNTDDIFQQIFPTLYKPSLL